MPLFEYQCEACGHRVEIIQKFSDPPPEACESCGKGPVVRLQSSPAIQFKGTGWYNTDYARKGQSDTSERKSSSKSDAPKTDSAKTDTPSTTDTAPKAEAPAKTDKTSSTP